MVVCRTNFENSSHFLIKIRKAWRVGGSPFLLGFGILIVLPVKNQVLNKSSHSPGVRGFPPIFVVDWNYNISDT
jgi:hypothetical protein